jgi:hypothetical protein
LPLLLALLLAAACFVAAWCMHAAACCAAACRRCLPLRLPAAAPATWPSATSAAAASHLPRRLRCADVAAYPSVWSFPRRRCSPEPEPPRCRDPLRAIPTGARPSDAPSPPPPAIPSPLLHRAGVASVPTTVSPSPQLRALLSRQPCRCAQRRRSSHLPRHRLPRASPCHQRFPPLSSVGKAPTPSSSQPPYTPPPSADAV